MTSRQVHTRQESSSEIKSSIIYAGKITFIQYLTSIYVNDMARLQELSCELLIRRLPPAVIILQLVGRNQSVYQRETTHSKLHDLSAISHSIVFFPNTSRLLLITPSHRDAWAFPDVRHISPRKIHCPWLAFSNIHHGRSYRAPWEAKSFVESFTPLVLTRRCHQHRYNALSTMLSWSCNADVTVWSYCYRLVPRFHQVLFSYPALLVLQRPH